MPSTVRGKYIRLCFRTHFLKNRNELILNIEDGKMCITLETNPVNSFILSSRFEDLFPIHIQFYCTICNIPVLYLKEKKKKVKVAQSCLTLCNRMDCSPPDSSVHGILQARILEWVAIPFYRESSWPRDQTWISCTAGGLFTIWATREAPFNIWIISSIIW